MDDLDKMARELLAAAHERAGSMLQARDIRSGRLPPGVGWADEARVALSAIRTALTTAPEGFKLVPVKPTGAMIDDGCLALAGSIGGYEAGCVRACWAVMLAAAKEVGNG